MRLSVTGILVCLLCASQAYGDVVKKDLRTAPLPGEQFVYFCADGNSTGVVGLVQGDQVNGFQLDDWTVGGEKSPTTKRQRSLQETTVQGCAQSALSDKANMFVMEVDPKPYADAKDALAQLRIKGRTDITDVIIAFGQLLGIHIPPALAKPFDYIKATGLLNPGTYNNGGQWLWKPPTIKMAPLPPSDQKVNADSSAVPSQVPAATSTSPDLIQTGLTTVKFIARSALQRLYQALADAEDNPNVSYDIELQIVDGVAKDVFVHPVQMKRDPTLEQGDSVCVYVNSEAPVINFVEFLDSILVLATTNESGVAQVWGFSPDHPLLGTPQNWQAAVTTPPACYLTAAKGPSKVALLPSTGGLRYVSTLVRSVPRYPNDPVTFNARAPLALSTASTSPELSGNERAWITYRSYINQTKTAARTRAETFARLSAGEIAKRRSFAKEAADADETSSWFREYFVLREIGWHEFQANKYKGLQDQLLARYPQGQAALYTVAITNAKMLKDTDIGPSLVAQGKQYQALMTTSILAKQIVAEQYSPDMTPVGRVCDVVPARCATALREIEPDQGRTLVEWQFGGKKQKQFANVLAIGAFSTAAPVSLDGAFGWQPVNGDGKCKTFDPPGNPLQVGAQKFELSITNTTKQQRTFTLIYAGSFTRAYWSGVPGSNYVATLQPDEARNISIEFMPDLGYEDLNAVYITEDGRLQGALTLDYSVITDSPMRTIEIDSGGVESGNDKGRSTYDIAVAKPPVLHSARKACVWISGDRIRCGEYADCDFKGPSEDTVAATFSLQGHHENPGARPISVGHLKVTYQLTSDPPALK